MENTIVSPSPRPRHAAVLPYWVAAPVLALGPYLTARVILANQDRAVLAAPYALPCALFVLVVLLWSPLSLSLPGALLQFAREDALATPPRALPPALWRVVRAAILVPYLALAPTSRVRLETLASIAGWLAAVAYCAPHLRGLAPALGLG